MHHEPFLYDLVRAHQRDLRIAADQYRLARSVRRASFHRLRAAGLLIWLARGARRTVPATHRPSHPRPDPPQPAECCC